MAGAELLLVGIWALALSVCDLRWRSLPNWLTLGGAAAVLIVRFATGGAAGFTDALAAGAVAGAFLLLPFLSTIKNYSKMRQQTEWYVRVST